MKTASGSRKGLKTQKERFIFFTVIRMEHSEFQALLNVVQELVSESQEQKKIADIDFNVFLNSEGHA